MKEEMKKKMKERLMEIQKRFDFLWDEGIREEVEKIHVFYEECENCSEKDRCPNRKNFEKEAILLLKLSEMMEERRIDSELHPLTSEDNGELGEVVCEEGGVMPVSTKLKKEAPVFTPEHNFLVVELEDGRKYLYTTELDESRNSEEEKPQMMYW